MTAQMNQLIEQRSAGNAEVVDGLRTACFFLGEENVAAFLTLIPAVGPDLMNVYQTWLEEGNDYVGGQKFHSFVGAVLVEAQRN